MGDPFQPGGLRLSDGSRIGGWSMDVIDGKRDEALAPDAGPQEALTADADSFPHRMAANLPLPPADGVGAAAPALAGLPPPPPPSPPRALLPRPPRLANSVGLLVGAFRRSLPLLRH